MTEVYNKVHWDVEMIMDEPLTYWNIIHDMAFVPKYKFLYKKNSVESQK